MSVHAQRSRSHQIKPSIGLTHRGLCFSTTGIRCTPLNTGAFVMSLVFYAGMGPGKLSPLPASFLNLAELNNGCQYTRNPIPHAATYMALKCYDKTSLPKTRWKSTAFQPATALQGAFILLSLLPLTNPVYKQRRPGISEKVGLRNRLCN